MLLNFSMCFLSLAFFGLPHAAVVMWSLFACSVTKNIDGTHKSSNTLKHKMQKKIENSMKKNRHTKKSAKTIYRAQ